MMPGRFKGERLEYQQETLKAYCRAARSECKGVNLTNEVMYRLAWNVRDKCLFLTSKGRIGLCTAAVVAVGDLCCILAGAPVPFLLTPATKQRHKLVEECYIHGVMHGELLDECEFGSIFLE